LVGSLVQPARQSSIKTFEAGLRAIPGLVDPSEIDAKLVARLYDGARCACTMRGELAPALGLANLRRDTRSATIAGATPLESARSASLQFLSRISVSSGANFWTTRMIDCDNDLKSVSTRALPTAA